MFRFWYVLEFLASNDSLLKDHREPMNSKKNTHAPEKLASGDLGAVHKLHRFKRLIPKRQLLSM